MSEERRHSLVAAALTAALAFLPFLRGALASGSFYFRDLSLHFFPLRRFALDGLRAGELRLWNPLVHEGVPLSPPALGYPVDLLQLLSPHEPFLSLVLALHVPLAALGFFCLARGLGLRSVAAAGGGLVYALGGFFLSSVNLYIHAQAAAWAPLVVLGLTRVLADASRRSVALAAAALGLALSTTGVEYAALAVLAGLLLGARRGPGPGRRAAAATAAVALAAALAAPVLLLLFGQVAGSARAQGFTTDVVLAHSVHPMALAQTLVGGLFGDLHDIANVWWGDNFFPRGFPYLVSLYLGATVAALAAAGLACGHPLSPRLALLLAASLVACLGRYAGLAPLVDAFPLLHAFRFPVKAFFGVHLSCALLAAIGLDALASGRRLRTLAGAAAALGGLLAAAPLLPALLSAPSAAFAAAFLPPRIHPAAQLPLLGRVLADAALGGLLALAAAALAWLAGRGRLEPRRAAWLVAAVAAADLLRTGAGLNPAVSRRFYEPSPQLAERLPELRQGRVFTCSVESSRRYAEGRLARGRDHEAWSFAALLETLTPGFNVPLGVPTALSPDLTMLVPTERVLSPEEASCRELDRVLPRLREAAVATVLSLDPLEHAQLEPAFVTSPARIAPLAVHAYRLRDPLPRFRLSGRGEVVLRGEAPGRLVLEVAAPDGGALLVRDARDRGWRAELDGRAVPLVAAGRHFEVPLPPGRGRLELVHEARGLGVAYVLALAALVAVVVLARGRGSEPAHANSPAA